MSRKKKKKKSRERRKKNREKRRKKFCFIKETHTHNFKKKRCNIYNVCSSTCNDWGDLQKKINKLFLTTDLFTKQMLTSVHYNPFYITLYSFFFTIVSILLLKRYKVSQILFVFLLSERNWNTAFFGGKAIVLLLQSEPGFYLFGMHSFFFFRF
jgi:hypothetical protein